MYCYIDNQLFGEMCLSPIATQLKAILDPICQHESNLEPINQANLKATYVVSIQLKWHCAEHTYPHSLTFHYVLRYN